MLKNLQDVEFALAEVVDRLRFIIEKLQNLRKAEAKRQKDDRNTDRK